MNQNDKNINAVADALKEFISDGIGLEAMRKSLTRLYVTHTRMLINDPNKISNYEDNGLYALSEIIEILNGGY